MHFNQNITKKGRERKDKKRSRPISHEYKCKTPTEKVRKLNP